MVVEEVVVEVEAGKQSAKRSLENTRVTYRYCYGRWRWGHWAQSSLAVVLKEEIMAISAIVVGIV